MTAFIVETQQGRFTDASEIVCPEGGTPVALRDIVEAAKDRRVLLYAHGGLVPAEDGKKNARRLSGCGSRRFPIQADDVVQVYMVWSSGFMDSIAGALQDSAVVKVFKVIDQIFPTETSGTKSLMPNRDVAFLKADVDQLLRAAGLTEDEARQSILFEEPQPVDENSQRSLGTQRSGLAIFGVASLVKICVQAIKAIIARRNSLPQQYPYPFEALAIEEVMNASPLGLVGRLSWKQMKDDAAAHGKDEVISGFFRDLLRAADQLVLVGHSAGAILAMKLLTEASKGAEKPRAEIKVAFMAPAISIPEFAALAASIPADGWLNQPVQVYNQTAEDETRNAIQVNRFNVYPCSLLHLVSFVFEETRPAELLGMEWYAHKADIGTLVARDTDHGCKSHGGFDDSEEVLRRLVGSAGLGAPA